MNKCKKNMYIFYGDVIEIHLFFQANKFIFEE